MSEHRQDGMEERPSLISCDDRVDLSGFITAFQKQWWKISLFALAVSLITTAVTLQMANIYQATAVVTPALDERKQNPALGALASLGVDVGGPSRVEDLDSLFKSRDLTVRVFRKTEPWPSIFGDEYDSTTKRRKTSWIREVFGKKKGQGPPDDWDAIRAAKDRLTISINKRAGTLSVSFQALSPEGAARMVEHYLEEAKSRIQEEALQRASRNKNFIEGQISRTLDPLTRERLYYLYGQEIEREMMARNREQFGFRVVDSARIPDRKFRPHRTQIVALSFFLAFLAGTFYFVVYNYRGRNDGTK